MTELRMSLEGLLKPGALDAWSREKKATVALRIKTGMMAVRPVTDAIMKEETVRAFNFSKAGSGKLKTSWRINVYAADKSGVGGPVMVVKNLAKWFKIHTTGGTIGNKTTPRALLIPINTAADTRIGTKKFYQMIDWLRREKLTVIKDGILYVKPLMNTSKRGGVAVGSRVQKGFRAKFSGSRKRPSGFDIKLNPDGLTPIAIIRTRITMKRRMNLEDIAARRLLPVIARSIQSELDKPGLAFRA